MTIDATIDPFAATSSSKSVSWNDQDEDAIKCPVTYKLRVSERIDPAGRQSTTQAGEPKFWNKRGTQEPDPNSPMIDLILKAVAEVAPPQRPDLQGEELALFIQKYRKGDLFQKFAAAQQKLGRVLDVGDLVTVTLVAREKIENSEFRRKIHEVSIEAGQGANPFASSAPAAAPASRTAGTDDPPF